MQLFMKQKMFSFGDHFNVWDEAGNDRWEVEQELFTWGKKLHIYDAQGNEVADIQREIFTFRPRFTVTISGVETAEIVKHFTLFYREYEVNGPDWRVDGEFLSHEFTIWHGETQVAAVHKEWMTWGDCYTIEIADPSDELLVLAVVLAIDCVAEAANNN